MTDKQEKPDAVPEVPDYAVVDEIDFSAIKSGDKIQIANGDWFYVAGENGKHSIVVEKNGKFPAVPHAIITGHIGSAIAAANGLTNDPQNETSADTISDSGIAKGWRSDTPRTDAATNDSWAYPMGTYVLADHARQLERELAEAQSTIEGLRNPPSYRKMDMTDADYIDTLERENAAMKAGETTNQGEQ